MFTLSGFTLSFPRLSQTIGQVTHVLLSRLPNLRSDLHDLIELQKQYPPAGSTGIKQAISKEIEAYTTYVYFLVALLFLNLGIFNEFLLLPKKLSSD